MPASDSDADRLEVLTDGIGGAATLGAHARLIARGAVDVVLRYCWDQTTDVVGRNSDEVEAVAGWGGERGVLTAALCAAGYITHEGGEYVCPVAVRDCPEYLKRRWMRGDRKGYLFASKRSANPPHKIVRKNAPKLPTPYPVQPPPPLFERDEAKPDQHGDENEPTLWGMSAEPQAPEPKRKAKPVKEDKPPTEHQIVVEHWNAAYQRHYGGKYAFHAKDFAAIKRITAAAGSVRRATEAMDRYLACSDPFYLGHELVGMMSRLNRWINTNGTIPHRGRDEAAPVIPYKGDLDVVL